MTQLEIAIKTFVKTLDFMINLTPVERQRILKMGDKTLAFVEKGLAYAQQRPELMPGSATCRSHSLRMSIRCSNSSKCSSAVSWSFMKSWTTPPWY